MTVTIHPEPEDILTEADIEPWRVVPVSIAVDLVPDQQLDIGIRPINPPGRQPKLFGRAVTARAEPPDFGAVLHALEWVGRGDVLVIAADGRDDAAMIGEVLGGHLRRRGAAGIVCDGAVRDVATLSGWADFSVFARAANPRGPTAASAGAVNAPVDISGRSVNPGDLIIGDDDGLIALSPATVRSRLADAEAKLALEAKWVEALAAGQSVQEIFDLAPASLDMDRGR
ncbi:MAG: dimethylmenaquinone methyltransferase [Alphaproteobacteria bacterium]|nr:dimethylmenaquinone methyltransferase [Alphaproteobacteria bacterium]